MNANQRVYLFRHGPTDWSGSGRHTGRTDVPLNAAGEDASRALEPMVREIRFSMVLTSPSSRAQLTCELAGLGRTAEPDDSLAEWDYGEYEGKTSAEIHRTRVDWSLFRDGCPAGESPAQVSERADRCIARVRVLTGNIALFTHGHFARVLAARWAGLPVGEGRVLVLDPARFGILGYEHDSPSNPAVFLWNFGPGRIY
jgi:probable phosphoglycerate mutase